jgi:hypothetical protein
MEYDTLLYHSEISNLGLSRETTDLNTDKRNP